MKKPLDEDVNGEIVARAREESVPKLVDFVAAHADEMLFDEKRIGEIRLALEEALGNIIRFSCTKGSEEIRITVRDHEMGAIILNIIDNGTPFNMLVMSAFPEMLEVDVSRAPSTNKMKRFIRDVEYRRDGSEGKNILAWVVSR